MTHPVANCLRALHGLVVCGGKSLRMGKDKSMFPYHNKPQRYHLYDMMLPLCEKVFIACNSEQASSIPPEYHVITDNAVFSNIGPMAALLSAFEIYPHASLMVVGCDYPFIKSNDLLQLIHARNAEHPAVCYFNGLKTMEEPLLTVYENSCYPLLLQKFKTNEYSLRYFLKELQAKKLTASSPLILTSVDTPEAYEEALGEINKEKQ